MCSDVLISRAGCCSADEPNDDREPYGRHVRADAYAATVSVPAILHAAAAVPAAAAAAAAGGCAGGSYWGVRPKRLRAMVRNPLSLI